MRLRDATQELIPGYSVFALSSQAKLRAEIGREALMEDDDDAENEDELSKVDRLYLGGSLLCSLSRMAKEYYRAVLRYLRSLPRERIDRFVHITS